MFPSSKGLVDLTSFSLGCTSTLEENTVSFASFAYKTIAYGMHVVTTPACALSQFLSPKMGLQDIILFPNRIFMSVSPRLFSFQLTEDVVKERETRMKELGADMPTTRQTGGHIIF